MIKCDFNGVEYKGSKIMLISDVTTIMHHLLEEEIVTADELIDAVRLAQKSEEEVAKIMKTKWDLGLKGGLVIGNPIPDEYALDYNEMEAVINKAIALADEKGIRGKNITPFLLATIKDMTDGVSFASNLQLAYNNARVASRIAVEFCKLG